MAQWRALRQGGETAYTFLSDDGRQAASLTYAELDARARAIAAELQGRGERGQRVLVVLEPGLDYVATLFGCFYSGSIAVPVYPPDPFRIARTLPRLQAVVENAECGLLVSDAQWLGSDTSTLRQACPRGAIDVREVSPQRASAWRPLAPAAEDVALLQYTSGTTGAPRGVAITHANLRYNLRAMEQLLDVPDAVAAFWLPPYHDLGLIGGVFLPLFAGRRTVLMSPLDFVRRPASWLRAISEFGATTSAAPNFGYELCTRKISDEDCEGLDLSCWQVAVSGAEPVRSATLDRFCEKFAPYGFRREAFVPAYGMAETTLMVSVGPLHRAPLERDYKARDMAESIVSHRNGKVEPTRRLVGCGPPGPGIDLRIVDPATGAEVDGVGEIWVRSPGVSTGYWRNAEQTRLAFSARLANGEAGFLRTGDLGFLDGGELFVAGRLKETLILGGRNYFPQDIELAIQARDPAFKPDGGAVAAVEVDGEERIVVFHEIQRPKRHDLEALVAIVREVVLEETLQQPHAVVLLPVGELPKTSSGKTRRAACWYEFQEGLLSPLQNWVDGADSAAGAQSEAHDPPATATERFLATAWEALLDVPGVCRQDNFFSLGGRSLQVIELLQEVAQQRGKTIEARQLFEHPTLAAFATVIDAASADGANANGAAAKDSPAPASLLRSPQPLSEPQRRMWMLERLGLRGGANVPLALELDGRLDRDHLAAALNELTARRQMLRTSFDASTGEPRQTLHERATLELVELSAPGLDEGRTPNEWALDQEFVWRPFDLATAPLARAALIDWSHDKQVLLLVLHHLICDGASLGPLVSELAAIYTSSAGEPSGLDYSDYLASGVGVADPQAASAYWSKRLADLPPAINLPLDDGEPAAEPRGVRAIADQVPVDLAEAVEALAVAEQVTPFLVYLSAYQLLLGRYSNDERVVVGVAQAGRAGAAWRGALGCFMSAVPIAATVTGEQPYREFLRRLRDDALADFQNSGLPWDEILDAAAAERLPHRMPLAQAFFLYEDALLGGRQLGDATVVDAATDYRGLGVYDLTLALQAGRGAAALTLVHDPARLPAGFADRFVSSYVHLLASIVATPAAPLDELSTAPQSLRAKLLGLAAGPVVGTDAPLALDAFQSQAERGPGREAVCCGEVRLSYGELSERSDRIAAGLVARGVAVGDRVALHLRRSCDMLATMLAVWKAGAAYVPLDPTYPAARLDLMIDDCRPAVLITDDDKIFRAPTGAGAPLPLGALLTAHESRPMPRVKGALAAYVLYTSGSTGTPKGVVVPHSAVANFLRSFQRDLAVTECDRVLAATTISFDISVLELFLPLVSGAAIVMADSETVGDGGRLARLIDRSGVTLMQGTPSTYRMLLAMGWRPHAAQRLLAGGEELTPDVAREMFATAGRLWNVYGPTETTIWSTIEEITSVSGRVPIGRPIDNTCCYVLDRRSRLAPPGVWGELAIGGRGVADGYHGRPDLTAERFPTLALRDGCEERVYLTGDLARWREDGRLEFGGRADSQVKVRGHRIEPGEVERALRELDPVGEAAVVAVDDPLGASLAAYFVPTDGADPTPAELRSALATTLPEYMIPSAFVRIDGALPRNSSGKLDRKRLPKPEGCRLSASAPRVAPRTPLEHRLVEWWKEVLRIDETGVHDSFFELGGHSLSVMQLSVRIRERLGVELDLREAYRRPTVAHWAEMILAAQLSDAEQAHPDLLSRLDAMTDDEAVAFLEGLNDG